MSEEQRKERQTKEQLCHDEIINILLVHCKGTTTEYTYTFLNTVLIMVIANIANGFIKQKFPEEKLKFIDTLANNAKTFLTKYIAEQNCETHL